MTIDWQRFADITKDHNKFLVTSHIRPDCDALGSELGMAMILEALGKDVIIVNGDATPPNLAFIDPQHQEARPRRSGGGLGRHRRFDRPRYERVGPVGPDE